MTNIIKKVLKENPTTILLLAGVLAGIAHFAGWGDTWVFFLAAIGVIPLAGYIGSATEALAHYTGPKVGGLLNATLGNAAELIITLVAIREGLLELVKASITGSIIGNLLLVMGMSMLFGGLKHGVQKFDRKQSGNYGVLLVMTILALVIPSFFGHSLGNVGSIGWTIGVELLSLGVAGVMIVLYVLGIIYSLKYSGTPISAHQETGTQSKPLFSISTAVIVLGVATLGVVLLSELLVSAVEGVVSQFGLSEFFIGIILIPIVGNVAEHLVAVQSAMKNKMELSMEISLSSSLQIALFVAPLLVFISLAMGNPLTLMFNPFELISLGAAVVIAALVSMDGESNWLEGAALLAIYLILGLAFFLLPAVVG
ncbi:MAG: calcium/proton exchanger [Leptolinea sp.]